MVDEAFTSTASRVYQKHMQAINYRDNQQDGGEGYWYMGGGHEHLGSHGIKLTAESELKSEPSSFNKGTKCDSDVDEDAAPKQSPMEERNETSTYMSFERERLVDMLVAKDEELVSKDKEIVKLRELLATIGEMTQRA
eukprot:gnl/MRDRNA2_/MRDRNA2_75642_c0_seq1.p1 gnl/MRDRNA2_/MRDRNA2_75642_c0~~gnl/MRDRNA2_/MRDRNA2_75642_c0_seq1.p1  ORF type:complete len:138 (-),score=40.15 gnl/MRDRNA2_/MRDRNA2_75642_c0_seq1:107-520(-)